MCNSPQQQVYTIFSMAKFHDDPAVGRTLFFTGLVVLAEPLAATTLLSFVVFMVHDFPAVNERSVAFWCGIISKDNANSRPETMGSIG